jgi:hypothetical protein
MLKNKNVYDKKNYTHPNDTAKYFSVIGTSHPRCRSTLCSPSKYSISNCKSFDFFIFFIKEKINDLMYKNHKK